MDLKVKTLDRTLLRGKYVKLPEVMIEENALDNGTGVEILYGKNYKCAVVLPKDIKLGDKTKERITIILDESLTQ
jgi:hypothetical protein